MRIPGLEFLDLWESERLAVLMCMCGGPNLSSRYARESRAIFSLPQLGPLACYLEHLGLGTW